MNNIDEKIDKLLHLQRELKHYQSEVAKLKEEVMIEMRMNNKKFCNHPDGRVRFVESVRYDWDQETLKRELGEETFSDITYVQVKQKMAVLAIKKKYQNPEKSESLLNQIGRPKILEYISIKLYDNNKPEGNSEVPF